jgi:hypothetical protein
MHADHEAAGVLVEVEAAWLHHRFTQIHPFADGNGRVARAIASLVLIRASLFPLIVQREGRNAYIDALEKADDGDLTALVTLVVEAQRSALIQATEVAYEAHPPSSTQEAIAAVRRRLVQRGRLPLTEWLAARETADRLSGWASQHFEEVAQELNHEISRSAGSFSFSAGRFEQPGPPDAILAEAFRQAGQIADFNEYKASVRLNLGAGKPDALVLSFYALGPRFRGLIGVLPFLFVQGTGPLVVEGSVFRINYAESYDRAQARFSVWLERVIIAGLNQWRLTL